MNTTVISREFWDQVKVPGKEKGIHLTSIKVMGYFTCSVACVSLILSDDSSSF